MGEATFVVGGFLPSVDGFSSVLVVFMEEGHFRYAGKVEVYRKNERLEIFPVLIKARARESPFYRVPLKKSGDIWSAGLTREEVEKFTWVQPVVQVEIKFLEWIRAGYLRQAQFGRLAE